MDEATIRILMVIGAGVVTFAVMRLVGKGPSLSPRAVDRHGLATGVYLFTSGSCTDCETARANLGRALGDGGFEELAWEEHPEMFERLAISAVPATLVVVEQGAAMLYPGPVEPALAALNP